MIDIRSMTRIDLPFGENLSLQAGWNQTAADWLRFLELQSSGCFVAEISGKPVGTVTTCVFDHVGWIGMMLVHPSARRQGVGRALMTRAIQYLEGQATDVIRLDATPIGEPLYTSLGFKTQYRITRFAGSACSPSDEKNVEHCQQPDWEKIAAFDEPLTGYSRRKLFRRFGKEPAIRAIVAENNGEMFGYVFSRPGRHTAHVGPCMARNTEVGVKLIGQALSQYCGQPVNVDVPDDNRHAVETISSLGLEPARGLVRMCRGKEALESLESLWASGGPEKG